MLDAAADNGDLDAAAAANAVVCSVRAPHASSYAADRPRKRPRRKRKRSVAVPRLFKRDIRRYYATMLANVSNSHDHRLVASFFRTYGVEQLVVRRHRHSIDCGAVGGVRPLAQLHSRVADDGAPRDLCGVSSLVRVLCGMFVLHPDQVFSTDNVRVVTRAGDASSRVECDFRVAYHLLYDVHPVAFTDHIFDAVGTDDDEHDHDHDLDDASFATESARALMTLSTPPQRSPLLSRFDPAALVHAKVGDAMPRRAQPLPVSLQMRFVMHLDEARRLEASLLRCEAGAGAAAV